MHRKFIMALFIMVLLCLTAGSSASAAGNLISQITITSSNQNSAYVKDDDTLKIEISGTEPITIQNFKLGNISVKPEVFVAQSEGTGWSTAVTVPANITTDMTKLTYEMTAVSNKNPQDTQTVSGTLDVTYLSPITINDVTVSTNHEGDNQNAADGDTVSLNFTTNHDVVINGNVTIGKQTATITSEDNRFQASVDVESKLYEKNDTLKIDPSNLTIKDQAGNTAMLVTTHNEIQYLPTNQSWVNGFESFFTNIAQAIIAGGSKDDKSSASAEVKVQSIEKSDSANQSMGDALTVSSVSFVSDNEDPHKVVDNQTVKLSFTTAHESLITSAMINGKSIMLTSSDRKNFTGSYTIPSGALADQAVITYKVLITDAENRTIQIDQNSTDPIRYYAPFTLTDFKVSSSNSNPALVKNGDVVKIEFNTDRNVTINATIGGKSVDNLGSDNYFQFQQTIGDLPDNSSIKYSLKIKDEAGNVIEKSDQNELTYYAPITLQNISFESNNSNKEVAKTDDSLTLKFSTTHAVDIKNATINHENIIMTGTDAFEYTGSYTIQNKNIADQTKIIATCTITDAAGNEAYELGENSLPTIIYFAPIRVDNIMFMSNNNENGTCYIRNGDTLTVSVSTNHSVIGNAVINGENVPFTENDDRYTANKCISDNMNDQSSASFYIVLNDSAGNEPVELSEKNVANQLIYYAPLQATATLTSDNKKNNQFARVDDTITARITSNHPAYFTKSIIADRNADIQNDNSQSLVSEQSMTSGDDEGKINSEQTIKDNAGNELDVHPSDVIKYDKTPPQISITPDFTGFTNINFQAKASYTDANLDGQDISLKVNNTECYTKGDATGLTSYTKNIILSNEDEMEITATCTDHAGNQAIATHGKVIIDKTNPRLVSNQTYVKDLDVYQAGYVISQHFVVDEKYLKDVSCTLTNKSTLSSSQIWDVDTPIAEDGLKNVSIKATDMSSNESNELNYNFYIDGTPPKPVVVNDNTKRTLNKNGENNVGNGSKLTISLDEIWAGKQEPDHFTELNITDRNGKEVKNIINTDSKKTSYDVDIIGDGQYQLNVKATDSVGNETGSITYPLNVTSENSAENKVYQPNQKYMLLFIGLAVGLVIIFIVSITMIILSKTKKRRHKNDEIN